MARHNCAVALGARVVLRREFLRELARRDDMRGVVKGEGSGLLVGYVTVRDEQGDWHVRPVEQWEVVR